MLSTEELKKKYGKKFQKNPRESYPVEAIESLGFTRGKCENCGRYFWSLEDRNVCGDSKCIGGYSFIGNTPAKNSYSYVELWDKFAEILGSVGYEEIDRYPVVARWRDDIEFVEASVDDFIPYVVNGVSPPPKNPLIVPQPCLRFNDIENVGLTGSHNTSFIMIGQHRFERSEDYDFNQYLLDLFKWFNEGLGLDNGNIVLHEDIWAGSGNFGPCVEFFSGGVELANQVYMQYQQTESGYRDLDIKVLDMGGGYERNVWFSQGNITAYESAYPTVVERLKNITDISTEDFEDFFQYAPYLNADETEDVEGEWKKIANNLGRDVNELKGEVKRIARMYSIADHTRALLFGINDGSLPSNVGGGYNLRVMLRRALTFINEEGWNVDLGEMCEMHAEHLKPIYPELTKNIEDVKEILEVEEGRYKKNREKTKAIAEDIVKSGDLTKEKIVELYESEGVKPEFLMEEAKKHGREIDFEIPDIKSILSQEHKKEKKEEESLEGEYPDTDKLYYQREGDIEFEAKVLGVEDDWIILDKTLFYPKSGGQDYDRGKLDDVEVFEVQKFGNVIAHKVENSDKFKEGQTVRGEIDEERREQLTIHHTAIHVLTAACKEVLGNHVWQAGARKTMEKSHLDITHYESLSDDQLDRIKEKCNEYVNEGLEVEKNIMDRADAERKYGMGIYHGGAVPGKNIRIVKVDDIDVEACGGTHLDNTAEIGEIVILGSERIQDGVVRVTIVAGERAGKYKDKMSSLVKDLEDVLDTDREHIVEEARNVFNEWKEMRKKLKKTKEDRGETLAENLEGEIENGVLIKRIDGSSDIIKEVSKTLTEDGRLLILFGVQDERVNVLVSSSRDVNAGDLVREICGKLGGKGGGSPSLGQGVGKKDNLDKVMKNMRDKYGG